MRMMKYVKIIAWVFAFGAFQACANNQESTEKGEHGQQVQKSASFSNIEAKDLKAVLDKDPSDIILLDVRTPGEIAGGKIADEAVEMDFYEDNFQEKLESLDKNKPVYVYCKAGGRSSSAAKMLIDKGFKEVYNINGGIGAWQASGYGLK